MPDRICETCTAFDGPTSTCRDQSPERDAGTRGEHIGVWPVVSRKVDWCRRWLLKREADAAPLMLSPIYGDPSAPVDFIDDALAPAKPQKVRRK